MSKRILFTFLCSFITTFCLAYVINFQSKADSINKVDRNNKKQGFWTFSQDRLQFEAYYKNDTLNGLYKSYFQNKVLSSIGNYYKGKEVGVWYYFDETGHLLMEVSNIKYTKRKYYKIESYVKYYYQNGNIKEEGFEKYDDLEIDSQRIGVWKKYDKNGYLDKSVEDR